MFCASLLVAQHSLLTCQVCIIWRVAPIGSSHHHMHTHRLVQRTHSVSYQDLIPHACKVPARSRNPRVLKCDTDRHSAEGRVSVSRLGDLATNLPAHGSPRWFSASFATEGLCGGTSSVRKLNRREGGECSFDTRLDMIGIRLCPCQTNLMAPGETQVHCIGPK
jgi:hypothetical protein